ncbi:diguanylate cyclase domain-containing protein [Nakamurella aerolata]|uniref:Diguanylate cyclase n=1 Tax=Nakamurella aerolata TaxID=1656892 RepID=A0A849A7F4_9ACTN|nr:diguanylate cyclase [Nakamurella aerolata]
MGWLAVALAGAAVVAVNGAYLRSFRRALASGGLSDIPAASYWWVGHAQFLTGMFAAGLSRAMLVGTPWLQGVGALVALVGWALIISAQFPNWRALMLDAIVSASCLVLVALTLLMLVSDVQIRTREAVDLFTVAATLTFWYLTLRMRHTTRLPEPAQTTWIVQQACLVLTWVLFATRSINDLAVVRPLALAMLTVTLGVNLLFGVLVTLQPFHVPNRRYALAQLPRYNYLLVSLAAVLSFAAVGRDPDNGRVALYTLWFFAAGSVILRQLVTLQEVRELAASARRQEAYFRRLVHNSSDVIMLTDGGNAVRYVSPTARTVLGNDVPLGTPLAEVLDIDPARIADAAGSLSRNPASRETVVRVDGRRAGRVLEALIALAGPDESGELTGGEQNPFLIVTIRDVTEREALREQLQYLAYNDQLTGLPNRASVLEQIRQLLAQPDPLFSVLFVDLDRFKQVNDLAGHAVGDEVLAEVARRLQDALRGTDAFLGRLAGDEFVAVIRGAAAVSESTRRISERLVTSLDPPVMAAGSGYQLGATIGIAQSNADLTPEQLLELADVAMYRAKRSNVSLRVYQHSGAELNLHQRLTAALDDGRLRLFVAPAVVLNPVPWQDGSPPDASRLDGSPLDASPRHAAAVPAPPDASGLDRLRFDAAGLGTAPGGPPEGHRVPTETVLYWVDEDGELRIANGAQHELQRDLGERISWWTLEQTVQLLAAVPGIEALCVDMAGQLPLQSGFVDRVRGLLDEHEVAPSRLHLELSEQHWRSAQPAALHRLQALADDGVALVIDRFGGGYASLLYLLQQPVRGMKVSHQLIQTVDLQRSASVALLRGLVVAAADRGIWVDADGVSNEFQHLALAEAGLRRGQGPFYGEPQPATTLLR